MFCLLLKLRNSCIFKLSSCAFSSLFLYSSYFCKNNPDCYYKQLKAKEQENEELKEILKEGCLHNLTLITERRVLLQTLTEIKDIAEYEFKELMNAEDYHNMTEILQQILQKINEVENERN